MDESYDGPHQASFNKLKWEIPNLIRQTTIDMSVRLGLSFDDGWRYPLTVGFVDGAPRGVENVLAFVQYHKMDKGLRQDLLINVRAYEKQGFDFEKVFAHELVHAMLNDAFASESIVILPRWLHEGLAVFGADQGEQMVRVYVHRYWGFAEGKLLNGLEGPHTALDYAEDYWAVKYINEKHGPNFLHGFMREVIQRNGDVKGALQYTCSETWEEFEKNVRKFAIEEIQEIGPPTRGKIENPY